MNLKVFGKILAEINKCNQCGKCLAVCPTYWITANECDTARGLLELIKTVHTGNLAITDKYVTHVYRCLSCRACEEVCPSNIALNEVFTWAREQIPVTRGKKFEMREIPYSSTSEVWKEYLANQFGRIQQRTAFLTSIPERVGKKNAKERVGYFVGCLMDIGYPETAEKNVAWLVANRYEVIIPKEQECCGMPAISFGAIRSAKDKIEKNIAIFKSYSVRTIITGCPHCVVMIRNQWSRIARRIPFNICHIAEVVAISGGNLNSNITKKNRVGYQPACYLHRGVAFVPNINTLFTESVKNYVELNHAITCCGQAGINGFLFPAVAKEIASRQIERYVCANVDCIITVCPWCHLMYDKIKRKNVDIHSLGDILKV
ncbi:MAG: (Fe-S)-binding protein [bacterium]|nr:(Fe-S)-binding protein [bacterium]